jgi:hypothetical protein
MQFFIPHASDNAEAESVLKSVAQFVGAAVPTPEARIYRLSFSHNGRDFVAEVGKPIPAYYQEGNQLVVAIFSGEPFKICLPSRGVLRGDPILVGAKSVHSVEYFDAQSMTAGNSLQPL